MATALVPEKDGKPRVGGVHLGTQPDLDRDGFSFDKPVSLSAVCSEEADVNETEGSCRFGFRGGRAEGVVGEKVVVRIQDVGGRALLNHAPVVKKDRSVA